MGEKYRLGSSVILKSEDDLFLCYDAEKGAIMELNSPAFSILEYCKEPRSIDEIIDYFKKNFEEAPSDEKVRNDVLEILKTFKEKNIIKNG